MRRLILLWIWGLSALSVAAQETPALPDYPARYETPLSPAFTQSRRDAVRSKLPKNALAVILSSPQRNRSNDTDFEYQPDRNLLYLTGSHEDASALLLAPSGMTVEGKTVKEILFVPARNPQYETWNGRRFGAARAMTELGVELALDNDQFQTVMNQLLDTGKYQIYHLPFPDGLEGADANPQWRPFMTKTVPFLKEQFTKRSLTPNPNQLRGILNTLRGIKSPEELVLLQKAIDISALAHQEAMRSCEPGMTEYQLEAVIEYVYQINGAAFPGYPSIVGSGENSTILHYNSNRRQIKNGEVVLVDAAAEYQGYTADITRTFPANGKFSPEQKAIYELALRAQDAAIAKAVTGVSMNQTTVAAHEVIAEGLMQLGILKERNQFRRFTLHGVSHHIGLDVHDWGEYKLAEGMVITVEPGIYITPAADIDPKWWNIGVRIEDDILITANGPKMLSGAAPRTVAEIESVMAEKGLGNLMNGKLKN